jgi:hypothetical protein
MILWPARQTGTLIVGMPWLQGTVGPPKPAPDIPSKQRSFLALPMSLLIKLGGMFDETLDSRLGNFENLRPKAIAEEVETFLDSADQRRDACRDARHFVHGLDGSAQVWPRVRKDQNVVHEAHINNPDRSIRRSRSRRKKCLLARGAMYHGLPDPQYALNHKPAGPKIMNFRELPCCRTSATGDKK